MARRTPNRSIELEQPVDIAALRDRRWTELEAGQVLAAWKASHLSIHAFAKQHGLPPKRLYWWNNRLGTPESVDRRFVPIVVTTEPEPARADQDRTIVLRLGSQLVLEVHAPERVPPLWVATLLRELGEVLE